MISNRVLRVGYANDLVRVVRVVRDANVSCKGNALHEAHGIRVKDGAPVWWFVTDDGLDAVTDRRRN